MVKFSVNFLIRCVRTQFVQIMNDCSVVSNSKFHQLNQSIQLVNNLILTGTAFAIV